MTKSIVIANQKGGVGKTTITTNLAGTLASLGKPTLVIDLDPQGSATKALSRHIISQSSIEIFDGKKPTPLKTDQENLYLLPAYKDLSSVTSRMVTDYDLLFKLKDYIEYYKNFEYILIDTPPTLMHLTLSGMVGAEYLLIPISTQYFSLQGTNDLIESWQKVQQRLNPDLKLLGACISMHDKRTALANDVLSEINMHFYKNLFKTIIPKTIKVEEAQVQNKSVISVFPESEISKQYLNLAKEIIERINQ